MVNKRLHCDTAKTLISALNNVSETDQLSSGETT